MTEAYKLPAIVTAGDGRAAKAIYGESKVFLALGERPLVAHVVVTLQSVPEVDEVWVVGNTRRLRPIFEDESIRSELRKPLHIVEQQRNLVENSWETYRRFLAGSETGGKDPEGEELDQPVLYVSGDLPFATPEEISAFIARSRETGADYALGLVTEEAVEAFRPRHAGEAGIEVAYFNLQEGRLRQSNLHYARPARIGNRYRIEEMYEHRHQREFWNMAALAWRLFWAKAGGPVIVFLYAMMHLAGIADRWHLRWLADLIRRLVTLEINERVIGQILDTRFRFVITEAGGCAIDIDTEQEYDAAGARFAEWREAQAARARELYGTPQLASGAAGDAERAPAR